MTRDTTTLGTAPGRITTLLLSVGALLFGVVAPGVLGAGPAAADGGTTYYVATTGSDMNPCSMAQPCLTIGHAVSVASGGDTISVAAGAYDTSTTGTINVSTNVSIEGAGASSTMVGGTSADTVNGPVFAVTSYGVTVSIEGLTITGGQGTKGGGVQATGTTSTVTLSDDVITGNQTNQPTQAGTGYGGGVYSSDTLDMTGDTVSDNSSYYAGGVYVGSPPGNSGTLTLTNSTIAGNAATSPTFNGGPGGGVYVDGATATLADDTITGNQGCCGGGIDDATYPGSLSLTGTILSDNTGGNCYDVPSGDIDGGYNIESGSTCGFNKSTSLSNTDPGLGPLSDNGGPTPTQAVTSSSPAHDAVPSTNGLCTGTTGTPSLPSVDQRGVTRIRGTATGCDIGAYQDTAPQLLSLNPTSGYAGDTVTATGFDFVDPFAPGQSTGTVSQVAVGGVPATGVSVSSNTSLTFAVPAGTVTATPVGVYASSGDGASNEVDYTVTPPAPVVTGVTPNTGPAAGGTSVTITGTGLTGPYVVYFGNTAANFTAVSDTEIDATAPPSVAGPTHVAVITPGGINQQTPDDQYTYVGPVVTGITPSAGPAHGANALVITGSDLTGATAVRFGGKAASFTVVSDTEVDATAPGGVNGHTVAVTVTTPDGTSAPGAAGDYTYERPVVTGVSPSFGPSTGANTVVITGSNLTGATAVRFGAKAASFTAVSDTEVDATSPGGLTGRTVHVTVTTPDGTSALGPASAYRYERPVVTGVSPSSGPSAGANTVVITGTSLGGTATVTFGQKAALGFTVVSDTEVDAVSPGGGRGFTVQIRVTTPEGTSRTTPASSYTYQ